MAFRNQMGSVSALSLGLATNPVAVPALITAAGVTVAVGAAVISYEAYKHYEVKKHRAEIEAINRKHEEYLTKIVIPNFKEIQSLPPIFKLTDDKSSSKADSLHYTDSQVERMGKNMPHGSDIALSPYRQAIIDAILKIKEYYFSRDDHTDITAGVLSYLLNVLENHCLSFGGYDYDIALLNALSRFVNAYASLHGEKSQHFSHLNIVFGYLQTAKQALEKHKEKLSLEEMLSELRDSCIKENDNLIRDLLTTVTKNDNWNLVHTVTHDELTRGILRRTYIRNRIKNITLKKDNVKHLSDTIFKPWLTELARYYLETMDPDTRLSSADIKSPEKMFTYPDLEKLKKLKEIKKPSRSQKDEIDKIEKQLKALRKLFSKSRNFLTTKLQQNKDETARFIPVTDDAEMIERTKVIASFATLIHQTISLQYLCTHLIKSEKQLGEIYVKNPHHFTRIFYLLDLLCKRITDGVAELMRKFTDIQLANKNNMQSEEKELFPEFIKDSLDSLYGRISTLGMQVKSYRERVAKHLNLDEPTVQSVKHEMFEVASLLSEMYHILDSIKKKDPSQQNKEKDSLSSESSEESSMEDRTELKKQSAVKDQGNSKKATDSPSLIQADVKSTTDERVKEQKQSLKSEPVSREPIEVKKPDAPSTISTSTREKLPIIAAPSPLNRDEHKAPDQRQQDDPDKEIHPEMEPIPADDDERDVHAKLDEINSLTAAINRRIIAIQRTEKPDARNPQTTEFYNAELVTYKSLREQLGILQKKSEDMVDEKQPTPDRVEKVNQTLNFIIALCKQTNTYLQLNHDERLANAALFSQQVHAQLDDQASHFLDHHDSDFWRGVYSVCSISLFGTDSRKKVTKFSEACDNLARTAINIHSQQERLSRATV